MAIIAIRAAREGMRLLQDVSDEQGRLLLRAGDTLQSKHLAKLERLGVRQLDVLLSDPSPATAAPAPPLDPAQAAALDGIVALRFRRVQGDRVLGELARIARQHAQTLAPLIG
jgi:hypothetical protein